MAFTKKTWKDRISQYLNRRRLVDVNTNEVQTVTVSRDEGSITEAGDAFSAANMNDLESRIESAIDEVGAYESYTPTSNYGTYEFARVGKIKRLQFRTLENLASGAYTTLDFTLPDSFKPTTEIYYDTHTPLSTDTIRVRIKTNGSVLIYNYTSNTGTINCVGSFTYI